jgi:hypothetical protein
MTSLNVRYSQSIATLLLTGSVAISRTTEMLPNLSNGIHGGDAAFSQTFGLIDSVSNRYVLCMYERERERERTATHHLQQVLISQHMRRNRIDSQCNCHNARCWMYCEPYDCLNNVACWCIPGSGPRLGEFLYQRRSLEPTSQPRRRLLGTLIAPR